MKWLSRREFLKFLGKMGMGMACLPSVLKTQQSPSRESHYIEESFETAMQRLFGDRAMQDERVSVSAPQLAENGASVPVAVEVDFPMETDRHIQTIYILSQKNPVPLIGKFHLTPANGKAYISTRIKMAETGLVHAIAETNTGALFHGQSSVRVTLSGCG